MRQSSLAPVSRTTARPDALVHWWIGDHPLLVTGVHGAGRTAVFTASLTKVLRGIPTSEELDGDRLVDVEPPWLRDEIREPGPYWSGILELGIALIASVTGRDDLDVRAAAEAHRMPLYERLAGLPSTRLDVVVERWERDAAGGAAGVVRVRNAGDVVARLVRGVVVAPGTTDHRFRDGFADLLPGEEVALRFETADADAAMAIELSAQNVAPTTVRLVPGR